MRWTFKANLKATAPTILFQFFQSFISVLLKQFWLFFILHLCLLKTLTWEMTISTDSSHATVRVQLLYLPSTQINLSSGARNGTRTQSSLCIPKKDAVPCLEYAHTQRWGHLSLGVSTRALINIYDEHDWRLSQLELPEQRLLITAIITRRGLL